MAPPDLTNSAQDAQPQPCRTACRRTKEAEGSARPVHVDLNVLRLGEAANVVEPVRVHEPVQRALRLDAVPAQRANQRAYAATQAWLTLLNSDRAQLLMLKQAGKVTQDSCSAGQQAYRSTHRCLTCSSFMQVQLQELQAVD